tara:strand:- start:540 stop:983 length:444 start_codon:yes stop_codon:yes gene_type:complete
MSKYNIVIETLQSESFPFEATGNIDGKEFNLRTIMYNGSAIFKVVEQGMCPAPTSLSEFTRGQRSAIAAFAKKVQSNPDLLGKGSQTVGATPSGPSRATVLQQQNDELTARLEAMEALIAGMTAAAEEPKQEEPPKRNRRRSKKSDS